MAVPADKHKGRYVMSTAVQEVQEVRELRELPGLIEAPAPVAEVPAPPQAVSKTRRTRRLVPAILSVALVGALTFAVVQTMSLSGVNKELVAAQGTVSDMRSKVGGLEGDLAVAENSIDSLESQVSEQGTQLAACAKANSLSVKADNALHDVMESISGAIFGSSAVFDSHVAEYERYADQWATAANACEPGGGYTFG